MSALRAAPPRLDFLARKEAELRARPVVSARRLQTLSDRAAATPVPPSFRAALRGGDQVAVIAEYKRRSPSAGTLTEEDPHGVASGYAEAGAAALSVLTDGTDFAGSIEDLAAAAPLLPTLRKDFVIGEPAILEARAAGAAAVLLIAALLGKDLLRTLVAAARAAEIEPLVEAHDEHDVGTALEAGAAVVGINNRNLRALRTDLAVTERLAALVPPDVVLVSESGIRDAADVARVRDAGAHAVLVGESLLRAPARERAPLLRGLASVPRR